MPLTLAGRPNGARSMYLKCDSTAFAFVGGVQVPKTAHDIASATTDVRATRARPRGDCCVYLLNMEIVTDNAYSTGTAPALPACCPRRVATASA